MSYQLPNFAYMPNMTRLRILENLDDNYYIAQHVAGPIYVPMYLPGTRDLVIHKGLVNPLDDDEVITAYTALGVVYDRPNDQFYGGYYSVLVEKLESSPPVAATGFLNQGIYRAVSSFYWYLPTGANALFPDSAVLHLRDNLYVGQVNGYVPSGAGVLKDSAMKHLTSAALGRF